MNIGVSKPILPERPHRWRRYIVAATAPIVIVLWLFLVPIKLTLYVSNQCPTIDPVDIQVEIDGQRIVNDQFSCGDGHNWREFVLPLWPGWHKISARSSRGETILQSEFSMFWSRWAVLDFWYYPDEPGKTYRKTPRHFGFHVASMPPAFQ